MKDKQLDRFRVGYQVIITEKSEYHLRKNRCLGVRSTRTRRWSPEHPIIGLDLRGCFLTRKVRVPYPFAGGHMRFKRGDDVFFSSRVRVIREPSEEEVRHFLSIPLSVVMSEAAPPIDRAENQTHHIMRTVGFSEEPTRIILEEDDEALAQLAVQSALQTHASAERTWQCPSHRSTVEASDLHSEPTRLVDVGESLENERRESLNAEAIETRRPDKVPPLLEVAARPAEQCDRQPNAQPDHGDGVPNRDEKRRHRRVPVSILVKVSDGAWVSQGLCKDIGINGMGIYAQVVPTPASGIGLQFDLQGELHKVGAVVRWSATDADGIGRFGVEFVEPPGHVLAAIKSVCGGGS